MHIILGGTGHVGSATATALLAMGEAVTIVTRDAAKGDAWRARGAAVAVADIHDTARLRAVFAGGTRALLVNPPADPATDTDAVERRSVAAILAALDGSGLEKVVAESTYGAQAGERIGDLSVLHDFEQGLKAQPIPASIIRAAYYFSNWDMALATARDEGVVHAPYDADFILPMVAPEDLGRVAAQLLTAPVDKAGIHYVEGPRRYRIADVAAAFAQALDRPVRVATTPRDGWVAAFEALGFSRAAGESYARMTAATVDAPAMPDAIERGTVTLDAYVAALVAAG